LIGLLVAALLALLMTILLCKHITNSGLTGGESKAAHALYSPDEDPMDPQGEMRSTIQDNMK
jgi:hypothetical protein